MVDAYAVDQPFGIQAEDGAMRGFEHLRHLRPDACQAVHVEKAPPVDLVRRRAPPGQAVGLPLEQPVQPVAADLGRGGVGLQHVVQRGRVLRLTQGSAGVFGLVPGCPAATGANFGE